MYRIGDVLLKVLVLRIVYISNTSTIYIYYKNIIGMYVCTMTKNSQKNNWAELLSAKFSWNLYYQTIGSKYSLARFICDTGTGLNHLALCQRNLNHGC